MDKKRVEVGLPAFRDIGGLFVFFVLSSGVLSAPSVASSGDDVAVAAFEKEIRPVLVQHCVECHGPGKQESGLRLDSALGVQSGGARGSATEPGSKDSLLLQAVRSTGELKSHPSSQLTSSEIEKLDQWVRSGAVWPVYDAPPSPADAKRMEIRAGHWAYQPLGSQGELDSQDNALVIDDYITQAIVEAGLQTSPLADRRTLMRRVTYDLTGLPPTPEEVNAFVADVRPEAFEDLIERLLASPQYGERWARHWLDVVRYTDSFDSRASAQTDPVEIWRYRDWVVDAINEDMPYDRFVAYQVAGDLMPLADGGFNRDGLIATGMLAIGNWPQGDADKQKMVTDIVDDQVDVVTRTFLGVTMGCARCHDHKFEPFSIEEYYGLAGVFFSSSILPGPGKKTEGSPILHLPLASPDTLAQRATAKKRSEEVRAERAKLLSDARSAFVSEHVRLTKQYLLATEYEDAGVALAEHPGLNERVLANWSRVLKGEIVPALQIPERGFQNIPGVTSRKDAESTPSAVANATDSQIKYATITQPGHSIVVHPGPAESVGVGWSAPSNMDVTVSGLLADADVNCGDGIEWSLVYRNAGAEHTIAEGRFENGGSADVALSNPVTVEHGGQLRLIVFPGGEYSCDTTQVTLTVTSTDGDTWNLVDDMLPQFAEGNPWPDALGNPNVWWLLRETGETQLDTTLFAPWWDAKQKRDAGAFNAAASRIQADIDAVLAGDESPLRSAVEQMSGRSGPYWIDRPPVLDDDPRLAAIDHELETIDRELNKSIDYAVGIQEGGVPGTEHAGIHDVRVHLRGEYTNLGEVVPRAMPAIVVGTSKCGVTDGSGRRDLAKWLTGDCAPLLARVMVNRVWQHHFGKGLVRTPDDFGSRGELPTHPELLDYLAARFVASGWSLKDLHRAILNSEAYQRSSVATEAQMENDPENRLLTHMNRRRLDAESLRDSLLFVSGRLDLTRGGPAYVDLATPRRTLYLRTVRSNLSTYAALFDGADPTAVTSVRNESVVAQQALFLLNHSLLLSGAEALSEDVPNDSLAEWVTAVYERLFSRAPTHGEVAFAETVLKQLGYPESTDALVAYAQTLLSSNEFYFID